MGLTEPLSGYNGAMRELKPTWFWVCEHKECGWRWIAEGVVPPEKCAKCKRRGWHTKAASIVEPEPVAIVPEPIGELLPPAGKVDVHDLRALVAGVKAGTVPSGSIVPEPVERVPCPYRDLPNEAGDIYGCALAIGHKGRHQPGPKVGDIW